MSSYSSAVRVDPAARKTASEESQRKKILSEFKKSRALSRPSYAEQVPPPPLPQPALQQRSNPGKNEGETHGMQVKATACDDILCCDTQEVLARKNEDVLLVYPMVSDAEGT